MKFTSSVLAAFLLVASPVHSFMYTRQANNLKCTNRGRADEGLLLFLSPEDLTDYMAKAHEAKIRAIKEVEDKKNTEINSLKGEVAALKEKETNAPKQSSSTEIVAAAAPPASGLEVSSISKAQLAAKLVQYQQFMAKYIVESQLQKMKAVKAAEAATAAKYEGKIALLKASSSSTNKSSTPLKTAESSSASSSTDTKLYDTRSVNVAAAAKAGKSRWGDKEVAKVKISSNDTELNVKPESSKEKVNGAIVSGSTVPSKISLPSTDLYSERNARVAAAAAAGKSRWGSAESKKATEEVSKPSLSSSTKTITPTSVSTPTVVTPEVEAADHGLRNDGGVGGPSLAERVNLGQQLFNAGNDVVAAAGLLPAPISNVKVLPSMYDLRNAKIAAAAAAGKSRWGVMENEKSTSLASNALPSGSSSAGQGTVAIVEIPVPPEVEAADHGLRNDGGVGGPSLAERINLGSRLI